MSWFEKLDFEVDIDRLRKEFIENKKVGDAIIQGEEYGSSFGGWALQSQTGKWFDGHVSGREAFTEDGKVDMIIAAQKGIEHEYNYNQKTELCVGYTEEVLDTIVKKGYNPRRARYTVLKAGGESTIHRDVRKIGEYSVRVHIPIITNKDCVHKVFEDGKQVDEQHFKADGSVYIMWTNNLHQIQNKSNKDRYHMLMTVWDTNENSQFYYPNLSKVQVLAGAFTNSLKWAEKRIAAHGNAHESIIKDLMNQS